MLVALVLALGKSEIAAPLVGYLDKVDKELMLLLNYDGGPTADAFWYIMSKKLVWVTLGAIFLFGMSNRNFREYIPIVLCLALTVTMCDQVSSSFIKPFFSRIRPSHNPEICDMLHYIGSYRGGRHGFVSSHAANAFGVATYVSLIFRRNKITVPLFLWSLLVGYSRIYLGVHYPGDVLGGAVIGVICGYVCYNVLIYVRKMPYVCEKSKPAVTPCDGVYPLLFSACLFVSTLTVFTYSCAVTLDVDFSSML